MIHQCMPFEGPTLAKKVVTGLVPDAREEADESLRCSAIAARNYCTASQMLVFKADARTRVQNLPAFSPFVWCV